VIFILLQDSGEAMLQLLFNSMFLLVVPVCFLSHLFNSFRLDYKPVHLLHFVGPGIFLAAGFGIIIKNTNLLYALDDAPRIFHLFLSCFEIYPLANLLIYSGLLTHLYLKFSSKESTEAHLNHPYLLFSTSLSIVFGLTSLFIYAVMLFYTPKSDLYYTSLALFVSIQVFFSSFLLFSHPEKVYSSLALKRKLKRFINTSDSCSQDSNCYTFEHEDSTDVFIDVALYEKKISSYMSESQPYLQTDCNLKTFCKAIDLPQKNVSKYLNQHLGMGFNEFINSQRIKHAISLLETPEYKHYTLQAIASMSGFSNRTTFIAAFKKNVGCTPSGYTSNLRNSNEEMQ
jgi:AraC-like DNA-binding protein